MKKARIPDIALIRYYRGAAKLANIPIYEQDGLSWIAGQQPGYPRSIFATRIKKREMAQCVRDVTARMKAGKLPDIWSEIPGTRPKGLEEYLLAHGFTTAWPATGMVLKSLCPRPAIQTGYAVLPLTDDVCIPAWSRIVVTELFKGNEDAIAGFADFIQRVWQDAHFQLFAAHQGERLLGTATLYMEDTLAWIGHVSVAKEARRQGIGAQLTWQAAKYAKDHGAKKVALHASALGEPVYAKLGFEPVSRILRLRLAE